MTATSQEPSDAPFKTQGISVTARIGKSIMTAAVMLALGWMIGAI